MANVKGTIKFLKLKTNGLNSNKYMIFFLGGKPTRTHTLVDSGPDGSKSRSPKLIVCILEQGVVSINGVTFFWMPVMAKMKIRT
jgi:hypothetical protein